MIVAQLSIRKFGLGILDIDTQLNSLELNAILFGVSGVAYFIWGEGGGQICPTLVFSKLEKL